MATLSGKSFIWKGTSWGTGTNGWGGASNATGAGFTGGYWNHADNWYEKGDGLSFPPEGSTGGDTPLDDWWKPATRFPRGRDMVILKRYSDDDYAGIDSGPVETLQWGGYTTGVWHGSSGDAGSGATNDPIIMTIESSYARTGYGPNEGHTNGSIGSWGPTWGGGSFGVNGTDRQRLMLNCTELRSDWDPGDRYVASPPSIRLSNSNIARATLRGLNSSYYSNCTVKEIVIAADDLNYRHAISNEVMHTGTSAFVMYFGTITSSINVLGRIPQVRLVYTKGTTGDFDAIRFVNIVGSMPHQGSFPVSLNCNVDSLNFWPTRSFAIGDPNAPSEGFWENSIMISKSSATGGITLCGEGRSNIREFVQGWGYATMNPAGSTWGCAFIIGCGLTIDNHIFKSGTIQMNQYIPRPDDTVEISDGEIDINAIVKGRHPTNSTYTGFRIGNFDDATGGYRIVNSLVTGAPKFEFPRGIYVKADYAGYTGGSIPGLGMESGGGK